MTTTADIDRWRAILSAILVMGCWTKSIFELEQKVDGSNSYIKFGRNHIKND